MSLGGSGNGLARGLAGFQARYQGIAIEADGRGAMMTGEGHLLFPSGKSGCGIFLPRVRGISSFARRGERLRQFGPKTGNMRRRQVCLEDRIDEHAASRRGKAGSTSSSLGALQVVMEEPADKPPWNHCGRATGCNKRGLESRSTAVSSPREIQQGKHVNPQHSHEVPIPRRHVDRDASRLRRPMDPRCHSCVD